MPAAVAGGGLWLDPTITECSDPLPRVTRSRSEGCPQGVGVKEKEGPDEPPASSR